jgi:GNAT superfamily N-acetyltransferase
MDYFIGKCGDVNTKDGKEFYLFNDEKIASFKVYNFDSLSTIHYEFFKLLPDYPLFNSTNTIIAFNLYVKENYRKKNYGKTLCNIIFEECRKLGVEYFLFHINSNNTNAEKFWDKMEVKKLISNENLSIFYKKL